ncbi:MAG: transposase [Cytophagales bacterium]|nr:transposase [Cytophagales bacterium]
MAKVKTSVIFKQYQQQQVLLLPPSLDELISPKHLVRVVNQVVESMDISDLINLYEGGGTSAYHPRMLLKVLLYAYSVKIYTGRKMARALSDLLQFAGSLNPKDVKEISSAIEAECENIDPDSYRGEW